MRADLGAFFEHHDVQIGVDLFQADRGRQARGARADDHDVVFHAFAFDLGHRHPSASYRAAAGRASRNNVSRMRSEAGPRGQSRRSVRGVAVPKNPSVSDRKTAVFPPVFLQENAPRAGRAAPIDLRLRKRTNPGDPPP
jgi:hypothetical protein